MSYTTIKFRRGPTAEWLAKNPVLDHGEPGYEYEDADSNQTITKQKIGDGVTAWADLAYVSGEEVELPVFELSELLDVELGELSDKSVLTFEAASGKWQNVPLPEPPTYEMSDLGNVDLSNVQHGYVLAWNEELAKWVAQQPPGPRVRFDTTLYYSYLGTAPSGTEEDEMGWRITRFDLHHTTVTTAYGRWTDRVSISYGQE